MDEVPGHCNKRHTNYIHLATCVMKVNAAPANMPSFSCNCTGKTEIGTMELDLKKKSWQVATLWDWDETLESSMDLRTTLLAEKEHTLTCNLQKSQRLNVTKNPLRPCWKLGDKKNIMWMFPKIGGKTPKMDGEFHGKPYEIHGWFGG